MSTIRCFYACTECKIARQFVDVPERDPATHDVVEWLERVAAHALATDHRARSPLCRARQFTEVGIPVDEGTEHVGSKTRS